MNEASNNATIFSRQPMSIREEKISNGANLATGGLQIPAVTLTENI